MTGREVFRYTFESAEIYLAKRDHFNQRIVVNGYRGYLNIEGLSAYDETWIPTMDELSQEERNELIMHIEKKIKA